MPRSYMPRASTTFPSPHLRSRRCIGRCPRRTRPRALVSFDPVYSGSCFGSSFSSLYDPVYLCYPLDTSDPWMQARTRSHQRRAVVRGTTTSTLGGPIQTVHAVAEHGDPLVLQPVSQVLRRATDMDMARYLLMEPTKNTTTSPTKAWYRKLLAEKILNNLTGILSLCNKLPKPESSILKELCVDAASIQAKLVKQHQYIPQNTETSIS